MKNIAVTGYFYTGSSAILDFLKEYSNVSLVPLERENSEYEHVLLYYAGGLFDLCNQLMHCNTIMGSDAAINRFIDSMDKLNKHNFQWFGSYQRMFGDKFMEITNEFVRDISVSFNGRNCNHCKRMVFSLMGTIRKILSSLFHLHFSDPRIYKYDYDTKDVYLSLPTHDELITATRKYIKAYMDLFSVNEDCDFRVFDHLIWPQQVEGFADYLCTNVKIIIAQRDVRDVFIKNKYLSKGTPFFPTKLDDFVRIYSRIVNRNINHPNAIIIQFEDMIYNYEKVEELLEREIGLNPSLHISKKQLFNPRVSIDNTQVFHCDKQWQEESMILSQKLPELVYDFPYTRKPDLNNYF